MSDQTRCRWADRDPLESVYHDTEWGLPERDPRMLWETLMLEGFQAGLSWTIILRKREGFRAAFASFDPETVARFDDDDIARLMADPGIVRARDRRLDLGAGARIYLAMRERGEDFADYVWSFTGGVPLRGDGVHVPAKTELSERISKDLKKRGFKFVGPTIVYAWMQAVGMVNDHAEYCFRRDAV
jgi:DNA-3-methyladenine glycosylase I